MAHRSGRQASNERGGSEGRQLVITLCKIAVIVPSSKQLNYGLQVIVATQHGGWSVHRRYSEFVSLRDAFVLRFSSHSMPPLPPKQTMLQDNLDATFVENRRVCPFQTRSSLQ